MDDHPTPRRRPRRTHQQIEEAILGATKRCIFEGGYPQLTFERVAEYAEVSKHVIYRRYPNRAALAIAATSSLLHAAYGDTPDTGSLRSDLLAWWRIRNTAPTPKAMSVLRGILADAGPAEMEQFEKIARDMQAVVESSLLARAVARGEITEPIPEGISKLIVLIVRDGAFFNAMSYREFETILDNAIIPALQRPQAPPEPAEDSHLHAQSNLHP